MCAQELEETRREAAAVVELLDLRQGGLAQTLDGNFPDLRTSVWQSEGTVQAAVQVSPHARSAAKSPSQDCLPGSRLSVVSEAILRPAALPAEVPEVGLRICMGMRTPGHVLRLLHV